MCCNKDKLIQILRLTKKGQEAKLQKCKMPVARKTKKVSVQLITDRYDRFFLVARTGTLEELWVALSQSYGMS